MREALERIGARKDSSSPCPGEIARRALEDVELAKKIRQKHCRICRATDHMGNKCPDNPWEKHKRELLALKDGGK